MGRMRRFVKQKKYLLLKLFIILVVLVVCISLIIGYFRGNVLPVVLSMSEATIKSHTVNAINNAVHTVIDEKMDYKDYVSITKDSQGKIQLIQINTVKINRLTIDLANLSQSYVEKIQDQTISLPLGAFTGSVIMAGMGPAVNIPLMPIGTVLCQYVSNFEEVGINQTRHSIYVKINTTIALILPVSSVPVEVSMTVLVCENIIIGEVPSWYLNSNSSQNMLDLIPYK